MSNPTLTGGGTTCPSPVADGFRFVSEPHGYFLGDRRLISVTEAIGAAGLVDYSRVPPDVLAHAAERGRAVHAACQLYDEGDLDIATLHPEIAPYLEAWKQFRDGFKWVWTAIEKPLYCSSPMFAGTPDRLCLGAVIDIKTYRPTPTTGVQMAGYAILAFDPEKARNVKRIAVELSDDGKFKLHEFTDRGDYAVFWSALAITHFKRRLK